MVNEDGEIVARNRGALSAQIWLEEFAPYLRYQEPDRSALSELSRIVSSALTECGDKTTPEEWFARKIRVNRMFGAPIPKSIGEVVSDMQSMLQSNQQLADELAESGSEGVDHARRLTSRDAEKSCVVNKLSEINRGVASPPDADPNAIVTAKVALSKDAVRSITTDVYVFLIARDPAQPSPPIAVSRLRVSELPKVVSLRDAQSMVQGRPLSGFEEFELLAHVSFSGGSDIAAGDWVGTLLVRPAKSNSVFLYIDQKVQ